VLPHLIGEGTGYMSPLLKPHKYYDFHATTEEREEAALEQKKAIACIKILAKESSALKAGQIKRVQSMIEDVENARLSKFYRTSVHLYTDKFLIEGYTIAEFTWFKNLSGEKWLWGVTMRDKLFDKNKDVGLVVTPGYTIKEAHAASSLLRRLPPLENPTYSKSDIADIKSLCSIYQKKANDITRGRLEGNFNGNINVIFPSYRFFNGGSKERATKVLEAVLKDVKNIQSIYRIEFSPEFIHGDSVQNIRCCVYMKLTTTTEGNVKPSKEEKEDSDSEGGELSADYSESEE